jgi:anaerobic selenocysteine-containing dehydrogenase
MERFLGREGEPVVQIHPVDAGPRGVVDGQPVRVCNHLGSLQLTARVTDGLIPGTALIPGIWWRKHSPDGGSVNLLTSQEEADMGGAAVFYAAQVFIEKVE